MNQTEFFKDSVFLSEFQETEFVAAVIRDLLQVSCDVFGQRVCFHSTLLSLPQGDCEQCWCSCHSNVGILFSQIDPSARVTKESARTTEVGLQSFCQGCHDQSI